MPRKTSLIEKPIRIQLYIPFKDAIEMEKAKGELSWTQFFMKLYHGAKSLGILEEVLQNG